MPFRSWIPGASLQPGAQAFGGHRASRETGQDAGALFKARAAREEKCECMICIYYKTIIMIIMIIIIMIMIIMMIYIYIYIIIYLFIYI